LFQNHLSQLKLTLSIIKQQQNFLSHCHFINLTGRFLSTLSHIFAVFITTPSPRLCDGTYIRVLYRWMWREKIWFFYHLIVEMDLTSNPPASFLIDLLISYSLILICYFIATPSPCLCDGTDVRVLNIWMWREKIWFFYHLIVEMDLTSNPPATILIDLHISVILSPLPLHACLRGQTLEFYIYVYEKSKIIFFTTWLLKWI